MDLSPAEPSAVRACEYLSKLSSRDWQSRQYARLCSHVGRTTGAHGYECGRPANTAVEMGPSDEVFQAKYTSYIACRPACHGHATDRQVSIHVNSAAPQLIDVASSHRNEGANDGTHSAAYWHQNLPFLSFMSRWSHWKIADDQPHSRATTASRHIHTA